MCHLWHYVNFGNKNNDVFSIGCIAFDTLMGMHDLLYISF